MNNGAASVLHGKGLRRTFRRETGELVAALDDVSIESAQGMLTALVGPDGAGKTTLIRLIAGLMKADSGELRVLGIDVAGDPQQVQDHIGYMPQRFGLYDDLTVQENLDLYADLHGVTAAERREQYPRLMEMTALAPFTKRLAGQLSGGMKQKLGLACALVRAPKLLLLDEPTAGVDPLSRQELWEIIRQLQIGKQTTILLSTSYLDEAERCGHVIVLHQGKVLAQGSPADVSHLAGGCVFLVDPRAGQTARSLQARLLDDADNIDAVPQSGHVRFVCAPAAASSVPAKSYLEGLVNKPIEPRFEDGFMTLLRKSGDVRHSAAMTLDRPLEKHGGDVVVEVRNLVRMFGAFAAVDRVSFEVRRGEIFGLLGPNGAGKTTTFRMLCGLLPITSGTLKVAGVDLRQARASARESIGYVAQKFSLYSQLTVHENLDFFASAYGLHGEKKRQRIDWALAQFELGSQTNRPSGQLPGGYKQRLAMAASLMHEPEILFLDEATSGADPLARREFWRRITALAEQGVTVIVTTHFMEEAEYCDRVAILDGGHVLAQGTPAELRKRARPLNGLEATMEDAFIAIVKDARHHDKAPATATSAA